MARPTTHFLVDRNHTVLGVLRGEDSCLIQSERIENLVLDKILETMTGASLDDVPQKLEAHV